MIYRIFIFSDPEPNDHPAIDRGRIRLHCAAMTMISALIATILVVVIGAAGAAIGAAVADD